MREYLDILRTNERHYHNTLPNLYGFVWINEKKLRVPIENIKLYSFSHFYPSIFILLYENGFIPESESENIRKIQYFIENKSMIKNRYDYQEYKTFVNSYYSKLCNQFGKINEEKQYGIVACHLLMDYISLEYKKLLEDNNNILYIDTDIILSNGDIKEDSNFMKMFKFDKDTIDVLLLEGKKRYVYLKDNNFVYKGKPELYEKYLHEMKSISRNIRLGKLGI